jgi:DNA-binding XRE family transcriptional regulator
MTVFTVDPKTASYTRIASLGDTFKVRDQLGEISTMSMHAYGCFLTGLRAAPGNHTLYDETTGRWMVGSILHLDGSDDDWAERLRAVRLARGMTLAEMAQALGYAHGTYVANLESRSAKITPMLERLIEAMEAQPVGAKGA